LRESIFYYFFFFFLLVNFTYSQDFVASPQKVKDTTKVQKKMLSLPKDSLRGVIDTTSQTNKRNIQPSSVQSVDTDGDGVDDEPPFIFFGWYDLDDDNDGIPDDIEGDDDFDGDGIPNYHDLDSDGDGIYDVVEAGNGVLDTDGDGRVDGEVGDNGLLDSLETDDTLNADINYTIPNTDGTGKENYLDIDSDDDGIYDNIEGQTPVSYIAPSGNDNDDNGVDDNYDTNGTWINPVDTDTDDIPNYLDIDSDDDGIVDNIEGQTTISYLAPTGNDDDDDGLDDSYDTVSIGINPVDTDADGIPDYLDKDADNDVIEDFVEAWDTDNNGTPDTVYSDEDTDKDGLDDVYDNDDTQINPTNNGQVPTDFPDFDNPGGDRDWRQAFDDDNDGIADSADLDDDNDGITDEIERGCQTYQKADFEPYDGDDLSEVNDGNLKIGSAVFSVYYVTYGSAEVSVADVSDTHYSDEYGVHIGNEYHTTLTYENRIEIHFDFSHTIKDLKFRINDLDAGDHVIVKAYDQNGQIIDIDSSIYSLYSPTLVLVGADNLFYSNDTQNSSSGTREGTVDFDFTGYYISRINFEYYDTAAQGTLTFTEFEGVVCDFDNDGIEDYLDLDSDGDGIYDIVEAGNTNADTDHDGQTDSSNVGNNGLDNNLETDDSLTATINYTIPNTDGTGNEDYLDIDADDDGLSTW